MGVGRWSEAAEDEGYRQDHEVVLAPAIRYAIPATIEPMARSARPPKRSASIPMDLEPGHRTA